MLHTHVFKWAQGTNIIHCGENQTCSEAVQQRGALHPKLPVTAQSGLCAPRPPSVHVHVDVNETSGLHMILSLTSIFTYILLILQYTKVSLIWLMLKITFLAWEFIQPVLKAFSAWVPFSSPFPFLFLFFLFYCGSEKLASLGIFSKFCRVCTPIFSFLL